MTAPRPALVRLLLTAVALSGCGGGAKYANAPRPPLPTLVAAAITPRAVNVSPDHLGAGLVSVVVTNLTASSQQLILRSRGGAFQQQTAPINPAGTAELKARLDAGIYTVRVDDPTVRAARLAVGAARASARDQLLLP